MSESRPAPSTPAAQGFWPSAALASAALLLTLCLRQRALHGEDTRLFVMWLGAHDLDALPRHFAFLPLVSGLGSLLRPLGLRWFDVMLVAAAIGSAVGVFALHRAGRRLCPPGVAWWLPAALLAVPAWLFFATAAEIHGVFLGPLGLCWWAFARWSASPVLRWALLAGLGSGVAAALHFTGHFLALSLVATAACLRATAWRTWLLHSVCLVLGHAAATAAIALLLGLSPLVQFTAASSFAGSWSAIFHADQMPLVAWEELMMPFLPWSVLALLALRARSSRPWALAALVTALLHTPITFSILSHPGHIPEHGAYLLTWAVPAVLASMRSLPRAGFVAAMAASTALALWLLAPRLVRAYDPEFAAGVLELRQERRFTMLVASCSTDIDALAIGVEDQLFLESDAVKAWVDFESPKPDGKSLPQWFDEQLRLFEQLQQPLLICASARTRWSLDPHEAVHSLWRSHVEANYDLEAVDRRGLHGWFLRPRPPR
ncbi:MAG TPA: hypothetical protein VFT55_07970 [Planctomycetota bacterium]|nr:hypothetical protein [Planctomycetota bacterium]